MRIAVSSDMDEPMARQVGRRTAPARAHRAGLRRAARRRPADWAWSAEAAARAVADGAADQAVVCCWTGTGASIGGQQGARRTRGAVRRRVLRARGARMERRERAGAEPAPLSGGLLAEILDAWFAAGADQDRDAEDRANIAHLGAIESAPSPGAPSARSADGERARAGVLAGGASERA